jgi:hypothetical protein
MESPLAPVLPVPRLRLSRNGLPYDSADAGPSIHRSTTSAGELDDDDRPTPRMIPAATVLAGADTPAARLRALLSRVPTSAKSPARPHPQSSPSEIESDFDPPNEILSNTTSIARASLKDVFSRAVREPGDTPQKDKGRWRRNSIDVSEVDATPRLQPENGRNKGKRRSLSDEEIDSPSSMYSGYPSTLLNPISCFSESRRSENSFKSSQAMTFDMLRERLMTSHSPLKDQRFPDSLYDRTLSSARLMQFYILFQMLTVTKHFCGTSSPPPHRLRRLAHHISPSACPSTHHSRPNQVCEFVQSINCNH